MQIGRFTSEQILAVLEEAEQGGATISALCRKHNINRYTFYRWRKAYGGPIQARAPNGSRGTPGVPAASAGAGADGRSAEDLAHENARLKRLLADRDLEVDLLKQAMGKRW
jgi:putative transposase